MRIAVTPSNDFATPSISTADARWAAEALASLTRQLEPDSVIGLVLQRTRRELQSLATSAECARTGIDKAEPIRTRMAA